jgi:predicted transglutaminase-like cysteine proteinase
MVGGFIKTITASIALIGGVLAIEPAISANPIETASYAAIGGETSVPWGWVDFCQRYEGECERPAGPAMDVNLTAQAVKEISSVNRWVNEHVDATTDQDHWGLADRWDYPIDGKGDCEDYALLKRKMLIGLGFPRSALLMTVVKDGDDEGHAILTIKTNKGEFVLDNLANDVQPWTATGYRFVKRQSQDDPNTWVAIGLPALAAK